MFNPNNDRCKKCPVGIAYVRTRIGDDELKRNCKRLCGKSKQKSKPTEPDLFSGVSKSDSKGNI